MNGYTATISKRGDAERDREAVEGEQDGEPDQRLQDEERRGLADADLAGRDRPRPRPLDAAVEIAIDNVVPGAAGAAHGERADEEQNDVEKTGPARVGGNRGKRR